MTIKIGKQPIAEDDVEVISRFLGTISTSPGSVTGLRYIIKALVGRAKEAQCELDQTVDMLRNIGD